jgi:hypothetical protein
VRLALTETHGQKHSFAFGGIPPRPLSQRWGDARAELLAPEAWQAQRTAVCRMLGLNEQPALVLERLAQELDASVEVSTIQVYWATHASHTK